MRLKALCLLLLTLSGHSAAGSISIAGDWQHSEKPVVVHFDIARNVAIVKEHQQVENNTGLTVIKNIERQTDNRWSGEMYDGYQQRYVAVAIVSDGKILTVYAEQEQPVLELRRKN